MDFNLLQDSGATTRPPATRLQEQSWRDEHSIVADAQFVDPAHGDYRVKADSPALALGFVNFPMDQFGVRKPELRALARTPQLPDPGESEPAQTARAPASTTWLGARVRNIADEGERSAFGLPGVTGVLVLDVPAQSPLSKPGLRHGDVILSVEGQPIPDTAALLREAPAWPAAHVVQIGLSRDQRLIHLSLIPHLLP
jgi:membrane-associated protease RseP (regulator of RpoE activity)